MTYVKSRSHLVVSLSLLLLLTTPLPSFAGAPTDQIKGTVDKAIVLLKESRTNPAIKLRDRRNQLKQILFNRFDFSEMAKRALGAHWRRRTAEEQQEFVGLFTDLLERQYAGIIESYSDEKIVYTGERTDGTFAEVNSKVFTAKGQEYSINYKAQLVGHDWKVYDVIAEDISMVNNFRSQFNRVISNSSYDELLRRLKEKQADVISVRN
ncbi:MAG: ABC transporter substrate-binding protein [Candidatus Binatia bacterium]